MESGLAPFLWRLENMSRTFKKVDYDQALDLTVRLGDCLPSDHLARFVVDSVAQLDLSALYAKYGSRGGEPYAPEMLLGLLLYGYATGVFSSRKIEHATHESVAFRFIAGNAHPDHDTLATFRCTFLSELKDLFIQVLLLAQEAGVLKLGRSVSMEGGTGFPPVLLAWDHSSSGRVVFSLFGFQSQTLSHSLLGVAQG